jgi:hypothetical protein
VFVNAQYLFKVSMFEFKYNISKRLYRSQKDYLEVKGNTLLLSV